MKAQKNLKKLLSTMHPILHKGEFIFLTERDITNDQLLSVKQNAMMQFLESEGMSFILNRESAGREYKDLPGWAWIEISVHSDLEAVGFLAKLTTELAKHNICVNAVSAYYHDHLFVPSSLKEISVEYLKELMSSI